MCQFFFNVFLQEAGNKGLNICSFLDSAWDSQRVDVLRWTGLTVQAAELLAHPTPPGAAPVDLVQIHLVHLLVRRVVRRPAEEGEGGENLLLLCSHGTRGLSMLPLLNFPHVIHQGFLSALTSSRSPGTTCGRCSPASTPSPAE